MCSRATLHHRCRRRVTQESPAHRKPAHSTQHAQYCFSLLAKWPLHLSPPDLIFNRLIILPSPKHHEIIARSPYTGFYCADPTPPCFGYLHSRRRDPPASQQATDDSLEADCRDVETFKVPDGQNHPLQLVSGDGSELAADGTVRAEPFTR